MAGSTEALSELTGRKQIFRINLLALKRKGLGRNEID